MKKKKKTSTPKPKKQKKILFATPPLLSPVLSGRVVAFASNPAFSDKTCPHKGKSAKSFVSNSS
jgi:hypothetical protein